MPKYLRTNATSKSGVNYIRTIVESHNCIFQQIDQENDLGIDALIEVVKNESPTGKFIAAQIKSGKSYFDNSANLCRIPIGNHREYWSKYALPVYGVVFIPEMERAYWVNIKRYLKNNPKDTVISYEPNLVNLFNEITFSTQFVPMISGEVPDIKYELAKELFSSEKVEEMYLGLFTIFKKYAYKNEVWEILIDFFQRNQFYEIPPILIDYLAAAPWHGDMLYHNDSYTAESRKYGKKLISKFGLEEVVKLLYFVDEQNFLYRGSLGQSVEAIVSIIPENSAILEKIILEENNDINIRRIAAVIHAYYNGNNSIGLLRAVDDNSSSYIKILIDEITKYGGFNPYA